jgi:hypothetical protein
MTTNGSGKLVEWYQQHIHAVAPSCKDVFGSRNQKFQITMISPTQSILPEDCFIQWW